MRYETPSRETTFGYLSALHSPEHGYFGGYLIVSVYGRPLEFHCTSPVRPSRAQEILYGPTLESFLLGDQISAALLNAAKSTPQLILTDQAAMLAARAQAHVPVVLVMADADCAELGTRLAPTEESRTASNLDHSPVPRRSNSGALAVGDYELQLPGGFESDAEGALESLKTLIERVDLAEPFDRIHEAIREAQRIGQRAAESHGQAA